MGISDDIIDQIEKRLNKGISRNSIKKAGQDLAKSIKKRTRLGKSVEKDFAQATKLKALTNKYKKQRKKLKKKGKLSDKTRPSKSNLTKSGSMVNNIKSKSDDKGFEVFINGKQNKTKAHHVQKDRPFMFMGKFELKILIKGIIDRIIQSN